jgi:hypothetical protein
MRTRLSARRASFETSMFRKSPTPVSDGPFAGSRSGDLNCSPCFAGRLSRTYRRIDCSAMVGFRSGAPGEHRPPPPLLLGHMIDLGVKPGPAMGGLLKAVYERQLTAKSAPR